MESNSNSKTVATLHQSEENVLNWRQPPSNLEAEQALLGAILVNNRAYEQVSDFVKPEHFVNTAHGRIFEAIGKQIERGQEANPTTLQFFFENSIAVDLPIPDDAPVIKISLFFILYFLFIIIVNIKPYIAINHFPLP